MVTTNSIHSLGLKKQSNHVILRFYSSWHRSDVARLFANAVLSRAPQEYVYTLRYTLRPKKVFDWRNPTDFRYPADPRYLYQFFQQQKKIKKLKN